MRGHAWPRPPRRSATGHGHTQGWGTKGCRVAWGHLRAWLVPLPGLGSHSCWLVCMHPTLWQGRAGLRGWRDCRGRRRVRSWDLQQVQTALRRVLHVQTALRRVLQVQTVLRSIFQLKMSSEGLISCRLPSEGLFRDAEQCVFLACTCKPRFLQSMSPGWPMQLNSNWRPVQLSWNPQRLVQGWARPDPAASCTAEACGQLYSRSWDLPPAQRQGKRQLPQDHVCRGSATCLQGLVALRQGLGLLQTWWLGRSHRCTAPDLCTALLPPAARLPAL